jgi:hypothetical protein
MLLASFRVISWIDFFALKEKAIHEVMQKSKLTFQRERPPGQCRPN